MSGPLQPPPPADEVTMRPGDVVPAKVLTCNYTHTDDSGAAAPPRYVPAWVEVAGRILTDNDRRPQAELRKIREMARLPDEVIRRAGREVANAHATIEHYWDTVWRDRVVEALREAGRVLLHQREFALLKVWYLTLRNESATSDAILRVIGRSDYRPNDERLFVLGPGWETYFAEDEEEDEGAAEPPADVEAFPA